MVLTPLKPENHSDRFPLKYPYRARAQALSLPLAFELVTDGISTNRYGEDITSCVLEEVDAPAESDFESKYKERDQATIDVLADQPAKKNPVKMTA